MTTDRARHTEPVGQDALDVLIRRLATERDLGAGFELIAAADVHELAASVRARPRPWWFHLDTHLTVFATSADPGTGSAPHDHGLSAVTRCLDGVEGSRRYCLDRTGTLHETGLARMDVGDTNLLDVDTIHAVFNCWDRPNVVLHVYFGDFTSSPKRVWDPVTGDESELTESAPLTPLR